MDTLYNKENQTLIYYLHVIFMDVIEFIIFSFTVLL